MPAEAVVALEPRKTPVQARSTVTVEEISEATMRLDWKLAATARD